MQGSRATAVRIEPQVFPRTLQFRPADRLPGVTELIAEGRAVVQLAFHIILYPGLFLGFTVLSINLLGDGLRDMLDPRIARRL